MRVDEVPRPEPRAGEAVVRVVACGICGSDVHFLEGMPVPGGVPLTLGHEPAGVVESIGEGVRDWSVGDRVAITLDAGCGECRTCKMGQPNACLALIAPGLHIDGAFAEAVRVPASTLVRVPDGVSLAAAAVATDCVASPYHALKCRARVQPGEQVVVVGVGGLGSQAVKLAKVLGAGRVVAVDRSEAALARATANGADATLLVTDGVDPVAEIRGACDGDGAEVALECVGTPETVSVAFRTLIPGGRLVMVGVGMAPPAIDLPQALFSLWEMSVIGTFASHKADLEEILQMQAEGVIDIDACISHRVDLDGVPAGLEMLQTRKGEPQRIVMEIPL
jgi:D-arabinose 1-dehydrogenase-like Zn-dependent alcohol dehydrogenase